MSTTVSSTSCTGNTCGSTEEPTQDGVFFRGVLIAIPAGLLLWAALLEAAGHVLRHL